MLKSILAVIVGYIVMTIFAFAIFTCAYLGLGVDRVFEAESYAVSTLWMVIMVAVALILGLLGGLTCAAISKSKGACMALAVIVLALGLIFAIMTAMKEHPDTARSGDVQNLQAMQMAQTPTWLCLLNPVLGAAGVLLGARMKKLPAP
jgi:heme/copper-type cytochrome/quinol oxidase subunit 3